MPSLSRSGSAAATFFVQKKLQNMGLSQEEIASFISNSAIPLSLQVSVVEDLKGLGEIPGRRAAAVALGNMMTEYQARFLATSLRMLNQWGRLRSVSLVIPQARILNYAQSLATGHAAFAGSAEAAFKATDSSSGTLMAESVDKRIGGMAVANAAQIQWGDAEAAMDYWALHITQRAVALGAGTPAATGQPSASN